MRARLQGFAIGLAAMLVSSPAGAQSAGTADPNSPVIAVPPAPAIVATPPSSLPPPPPPQASPPPGLVTTQPPADQDTGAAPPAAPSASAPDNGLPPQLPSSWVPGKTAKLGILNKVDGSISNVEIPVGGQANIGDLTISVLACVIRPPDQIPDAAIFVAASATAGATQVYRGWMVRSAPGAAVVGDAGETFRVIGCARPTVTF